MHNVINIPTIKILKAFEEKVGQWRDAKEIFEAIKRAEVIASFPESQKAQKELQERYQEFEYIYGILMARLPRSDFDNILNQVYLNNYYQRNGNLEKVTCIDYGYYDNAVNCNEEYQEFVNGVLSQADRSL